VNDYLEEHFKKLMNYEFTARMEDELDRIAEGDVERHTMMQEFYGPFDKEIAAAKKAEKATILVGKKCPKCTE
jgi:DNA topoisomerase-1